MRKDGTAGPPLHAMGGLKRRPATTGCRLLMPFFGDAAVLLVSMSRTHLDRQL